MVTILCAWHKKITPETELFIGDKILYGGTWLGIHQITQDNGIQLSNLKWVCRSELQSSSNATEMSDWELHEESGQQRLEVPGGTFWLSPDIGDSYSLIKITVDAAGPNPSKPQRFATEFRAKAYVDILIRQTEMKV